jgi:hypothetical protein
LIRHADVVKKIFKILNPQCRLHLRRETVLNANFRAAPALDAATTVDILGPRGEKWCPVVMSWCRGWQHASRT